MAKKVTQKRPCCGGRWQVDRQVVSRSSAGSVQGRGKCTPGAVWRVGRASVTRPPRPPERKCDRADNAPFMLL